MNYYSSDRSTLILLSLLKAHQIKYVIASPGTTNMALVGSIQYDPYFKMFSAPDERSAAYMACGLAAESGEPVVITCTEATASRNYLPALTEAFYRKLPILVVTGHHGDEKIGHLISQTIDRSSYPKDALKMSVSVGRTRTQDDEWSNIININKAILELNHRGKGPVHINLLSAHRSDFNIQNLPHYRKIIRFTQSCSLPVLPQGKIAIFVGSHTKFTAETTSIIDKFCEENNSVVFCDHTSGYYGKYRLCFSLVACQQEYKSKLLSIDLLIHIGEVSGDVYVTNALNPKQVWRVNPDGEIRDTFRKLSCVFEMEEHDFFSYYLKKNCICHTEYYELCAQEYDHIYSKIPELEFSNIWVAKQLYSQIPQGSVIHFGIFHSLRSWNLFRLPDEIESSCNVGGFGIDGSVSTLLGASLAKLEKLHFLVIGDLAMFYDMNSMGNRHFPPNARILLINNGRGIEFRKYDHPASRLGESADEFIAAGGHYGSCSKELMKHYANDLGFQYLSASNKDEFFANINMFFLKQLDKPIVFEVFTKPTDEINASKRIRNLVDDPFMVIKKSIKKVAKKIT